MNQLFQVQPSSLLQRLYPKAVWHGKRTEKEIYLTFDDGPVAGLSEWVLDELQKFNAKATFFCVGSNIKKETAIFKRISTEGHLVANHTMNHVKGFKNSTGQYMSEVEECKKLIGNNFFRPPYGQLKRGQYKVLIRKNYKVIFWDVISYDYEKISKENCAKNVLENTKNGSIVLFHDNVKAEENLKYALPIYLKHFSDKGFSFRILPDNI